MDIKTAYVKEQGASIEIIEASLDEPKTSEVLVEIVASGICHTDLAGRDGGVTPYPVALGHEGAGIVKKVGFGVTSVEIGDHVVLGFSSCGHCDSCLTGHPGMCFHFNDLNFGGHLKDGSSRIHFHDGQEISSFFGQSSLSTYVVADERNVVKVDKDVDLRLLGPLGCGIMTGSGTVLNFLKPQFGQSLVIFGTGGVGLSAIMAAKIVGLNHIIAVDIFDNRLQLAKELGATEVINSKTDDAISLIKSLCPNGVDYAIDTTGVPAVFKTAIDSLKFGGQLAAIGIGGDVTLNIMGDILSEAKTISGVVEGDSVPQIFIPQLINYYKKGLFPFDKLIKFYDFQDIDTAITDSLSGQVIKPIVLIKS
ncbi:NAD(P)-dependent alcohol dehydrogenase [Streptococcus dentiloxodontae]